MGEMIDTPDNLKWVSTAFVHFALIVGVAMYTVFGALSMQYLESPERVRSQMKRDIHERVERVYLGQEIADIDPHVHECLERTINSILDGAKCDSYELARLDIQVIDDCYLNARVPGSSRRIQKMKKGELEVEEVEETEPPEKWSVGNSVIFAFTVITTIGYGHIAPETAEGRLFCIIYGLIGVPFTLLTIADLGMFLTKLLRSVLVLSKKSSDYVLSCFSGSKSSRSVKKPEIKEKEGVENEEDEEEEESEKEEEVQPEKTEESIALGITFACYLLAGAKILSVYEPEMDFFNALYFNFVTLTTIGLGDFVPKSFDYLFVTLVYIGIGLALTTMAIEIAADLLKKIHYAGRKMENVASAVVWFGGKKMTMKNLVKHLGNQFNIPEEEMANFDMGQFVDNAMKVEKGEIATLRKPPSPAVIFRERAFSYSNIRKSSELKFMDDSRVSKVTDLTTIQETTRTMDTLQGLMNELKPESMVPRLQLDVHNFTDMSAPTSFDEDYMRTYTLARYKTPSK